MVAKFLFNHEVWYINFAIAMPITVLFALFSWWMIEKPFLNLRKILLAKPMTRVPAS